jgi:hypothetical protein
MRLGVLPRLETCEGATSIIDGGMLDWRHPSEGLAEQLRAIVSRHMLLPLDGSEPLAAISMASQRRHPDGSQAQFQRGLTMANIDLTRKRGLNDGLSAARVHWHDR